MKKTLYFVTVVSLLSLLLVACNGSNDSGSDGKSKGDSKSKEETLVFGRGADSYTMDPQNANEIETWRVTKNIYETLVEYDEETTEVVPKLAKDWDVSEDGKTWTFYLQEGVKFHDGTDFNAEAVVYNFERMMDPEHPARHDGSYSVYRGMFNGFKGEGSSIEEVNVVEENTVEFKLAEPQATFLANLGMHAFGIISPAALEEYGEKSIRMQLERDRLNSSLGLQMTPLRSLKTRIIGCQIYLSWANLFTKSFQTIQLG